jgi:hypothetical protein
MSSTHESRLQSIRRRHGGARGHGRAGGRGIGAGNGEGTSAGSLVHGGGDGNVDGFGQPEELGREPAEVGREGERERASEAGIGPTVLSSI